MADTLVERVTGQAAAEQVPVEVNLIMTETALFNRRGGDPEPGSGDGDNGAPKPDPLVVAGADEPAHLVGHGPIPAELARRLVQAPDDAAGAWLRRLYTRPAPVTWSRWIQSNEPSPEACASS